MSSLTRRGENCPASIIGAHWGSEVQHHCESVGFSSDIKEDDYGCHPKRPSPEGAGGSKGDPHRTMCQRTYAVPSYKSLPGSIRDRISNMSYGTLYRGSMSGDPGFAWSERKVACCEKCSATLVALKKQALSLSVHHHLSCKDSGALSAFLHENLRVHSSRSTADSRERERDQGECGTCGANLNQLKQEAVHLALSRGQTSAKPPFETSRSTGSLLGQSETKHGDRPLRETVTAVHQARSRTHSPHSPQSPRRPQSPKTPQRTPQTLRRRGPRLPNPDMGRWVEEQQQLVASASKSMTKADGVITHRYHEAADDATLGSGDAGTVQTSSKIPHISRVVTIANSAAMSFLARAAQKLNLTSRKKSLASDRAPAHLSTCFREIIQKNPPPVPSCLLQAATRTKDSPSIGKVKVVLRVSPALSEDRARPPVLRIDPSKKRVTVMEPGCKSQTHTMVSQGREGKALLRTYTFDGAYPQESSQAEVCAGVLVDVIRCVVSGSDGCVLGLGSADVGSWSSMVGTDESNQRLGLIPCAISWLYSFIERRAEKTWTTLNVSVSAIELCCGQEDTLRDLLAESVPTLGNIQDSPAAQISLQDDPVYGIQLRNHNRVKAPTAERAASLLDAAIAARRHGDIITPLSHSSIMFFTLHVQPPLTECSTTGKGFISRGATKLTMIDVCSSMRTMTQQRDNKHKRPHIELIPVILALLSGHKNIPSKGSKLTMLLRQSLGHINCHTTVIAQVDSTAHQQETVSTVQLASRIRRTQRRAKESTSCSPCGRSLCKEKRGHPSLTLRAFHSTGEVDVDVPRFRLRGDLDERSSSDQSCDTVIQIDSDGSVQPRTTSFLTQPEFVPIIPSLHPIKTDMEDPEFTSLLQELLRIPQLQGERKKEGNLQGNSEVLNVGMRQTERDCLKCETFAELQERLGCIDGSEITIDMLRFSTKSASGSITPKSPRKKTGKQTNSESSETSQTLMKNQGCSQTYVGQQQQDSTFAGENFEREDSGLYDCEECSAASSSEELLNQTHGLNMNCQASHSAFPDMETLKSGEKVSSQESTGKQGNSELGDWFKPDKRTSPVGKSSPISPSSSHSLATNVTCGDILPNLATEEAKEMRATITVTVQQPLDLKGQDELVFSMVEEVTISGAVDKGRTGGNIICIRDIAQSPAHAQGSASSQPIRIISNVIEESSAEPSNLAKSSAVQPSSTEANTQKPQNQIRRGMHFVPSFINPMLINTDIDCVLDDTKQKENPHESASGMKSMSALKTSNVKCPETEKALDAQSGAFAIESRAKKCDSTSSSTYSHISYETQVFEDAAFCDDTVKNKTCGKPPSNTDKNHPRGREHVYPSNTPRGSLGGESGCGRVGDAPQRIGASSGCQETAPVYFRTASLPRGWHNANHQERYLSDPRGVTSSTPSSPGVTLERRQGKHHSSGNHRLHVSPPRKYSAEYRHEGYAPPRRGVESLFETSVLSLKHDTSGRLRSPIEDSSRLFSAKLEQLTSRTNSLGRTTGRIQTLHRGSSSTSVSSRGSSKGSIEGNFKASFKGRNEGDSTLPRVSRSPKKNPRSVPMANQSNSQISQTLRYSHSKLSAVGKLKMAAPKVRRSSAPSTKNLSFSPKGLQQSISRSTSLSPDGKNISLERTASFLSSSPPRSFHSISRTPSQSSTCSSTKSAIQGFVNGRISDLLKERSTSPTSGGLEKMSTFPSPYSQMTAPRTPSHMSGHASDTTSVLSGDLPPAMGKTSLLFSNRDSMVSSGYDSMLRDSEATASSISNRDSVSDRSSSLLSVACSSRTSRRRGNTGSHQRRLSHDTPPSMRRSASGLRTRLVDRGIPEAYEIKVYEIDDVERMQKRAGAGKQGPACFSAKLKFLEHRQQRISEVRAKYNNLKRELEQAKQNLMLEPAKWNQEVDLWQTFEVDSLEHLEALEVVTARLESKVNLCKANVMMVTCFDVSDKRRHKRRRRAERRHRNLK